MISEKNQGLRKTTIACLDLDLISIRTLYSNTVQSRSPNMALVQDLPKVAVCKMTSR